MVWMLCALAVGYHAGWMSDAEQGGVHYAGRFFVVQVPEDVFAGSIWDGWEDPMISFIRSLNLVFVAGALMLPLSAASYFAKRHEIKRGEPGATDNPDDAQRI